MNGEVFTKETVTLLKGWIGDAIKDKVPFMLRAVIKPTIGIGLNVLNKYADRIVPDRVDTYINGAVVELEKGNYDLAGQFVGKGLDALAEKVKGDTVKEKFFTSIGVTIIAGIEYVIEERRGTNKDD
jgi:hypothetical protein